MSVFFDPTGRPCSPKLTVCPHRSALRSTISIAKSTNCTRRLHLLPEKLASTVTMSPVGDVLGALYAANVNDFYPDAILAKDKIFDSVTARIA
jgi:hypothetical protein